MGQLEHLNWRTSSYSGGNGGACVEVAGRGGMILVRDTTEHGRGPAMQYTPGQWRTFIAGVRDGKFGPDHAGRAQ